MKREPRPQPEVVGLFGVGLDGTDGHRRVTQAEDVILVGGSAETHERMQETVIKLTESLDKKGKRIREATVEELTELIQDAQP